MEEVILNWFRLFRRWWRSISTIDPFWFLIHLFRGGWGTVSRISPVWLLAGCGGRFTRDEEHIVRHDIVDSSKKYLSREAQELETFEKFGAGDGE